MSISSCWCWPLGLPTVEFLSPGTLFAIISISCPLMVVSAAMTMCLICAEVDLSVVGVVGLSSTLTALANQPEPSMARGRWGSRGRRRCDRCNQPILTGAPGSRHAVLPFLLSYPCDHRPGAWRCRGNAALQSRPLRSLTLILQLYSALLARLMSQSCMLCRS